MTAYNPFGDFTNLANDWYFENAVNDNADAWLGWVGGAGSDTLLTVPAYVIRVRLRGSYLTFSRIDLIGSQKIRPLTLIQGPYTQVFSFFRSSLCNLTNSV
jgi:hypothetical protein